MERVDESRAIAEPGSPDGPRPALRNDEPGTAFPEPESSVSPAADPPSPPPSPAPAQLPRASNSPRARPSSAPYAEQAIDAPAEAIEHKLPEAERIAHPRTPFDGPPPGTSSSPPHGEHSTRGPASVPTQLRASGRYGSRRSASAQPRSERVQAAVCRVVLQQTKDTSVPALRQRRRRLVLANVGPWTVVRRCRSFFAGSFCLQS